MASIRVDLQDYLVWYSEDSDKWEVEVPSDSRITEDNIRDFKYIGGNIVYLPDITPIDRTIEKCVYDWSVNQVRIYIKDIYITEPIKAVCDSTWTDADCQTYIDNLEITR